MVSYLGSLVQFSPAAGRAGRCRQMSLCVGSTRRVVARQPAVLAASPWVLRAFSLRGERLRQPEVLAASPRARRAFSLRGPVGSQEVFRQDPGPVCQVGGGGFSGAEFAPFPPPASYLQRGWGGSPLEFLSPFVLRTAGGGFRPVNFSSLSPSLKISPSSCSQGLLARPYPKQCCRLLSVPPPLAPYILYLFIG